MLEPIPAHPQLCRGLGPDRLSLLPQTNLPNLAQMQDTPAQVCTRLVRPGPRSTYPSSLQHLSRSCPIRAAGRSDPGRWAVRARPLDGPPGATGRVRWGPWSCTRGCTMGVRGVVRWGSVDVYDGGLSRPFWAPYGRREKLALGTPQTMLKHMYYHAYDFTRYMRGDGNGPRAPCGDEGADVASIGLMATSGRCRTTTSKATCG
jgi:hypothetical protein